MGHEQYSFQYSRRHQHRHEHKHRCEKRREERHEKKEEHRCEKKREERHHCEKRHHRKIREGERVLFQNVRAQPEIDLLAPKLKVTDENFLGTMTSSLRNTMNRGNIALLQDFQQALENALATADAGERATASPPQTDLPAVDPPSTLPIQSAQTLNQIECSLGDLFQGGDPIIVDLFTGQTVLIGNITLSADDDNLIIDFVLDVDPRDGKQWLMSTLSVYAALTAPLRAAPGQFPYRQSYNLVSEGQILIPLADLGGVPIEPLYLAVHGAIQKIVGYAPLSDAQLAQINDTFPIVNQALSLQRDTQFGLDITGAPAAVSYLIDQLAFKLSDGSNLLGNQDVDIYSSYEPDTLGFLTFDDNVANLDNLPNINYLLNTYQVGSTISGGQVDISDISQAAQALLYADNDASLIPTDSVALALYNDALANGVDFVPSSRDGLLALILYKPNTPELERYIVPIQANLIDPSLEAIPIYVFDSAWALPSVEGIPEGGCPFPQGRSWARYFTLNVLPTQFPVIYSFEGEPDGAHPSAGLARGSGGNSNTFYGVTAQGGFGDGVIYSIDSNLSYSVLYIFGTAADDGRTPLGQLVRLGTSFYGTTSGGGTNGQGIIFKIDQDGSNYQILHNFDSATTGARPLAGMVEGSDGLLYGVTTDGGSFGQGTIYSFDPNTSNVTVLHNFSDGSELISALRADGSGVLYGTTRSGGSNNVGTLFSINEDGTNFTKLFDFSVANGSRPDSQLELLGNTLYGVTSFGGPNNGGVIYSIETDGTNYQILHGFELIGASDGRFPTGILQISNQLYGVTRNGGDNNNGVVYVIDNDGSNFNVLYRFQGTPDGSFPLGNLLLRADPGNDLLYGVTRNGGDDNLGSIYRLEV